MCSRYELNARARQIMERFDLAAVPPMPPAPELRPTDQALIVVADAGARRGELAQWGLRPDWDQGKPLINARAESLAERRTFRPLLASRCLVPASAYFEWRRHGGRRLKTRIGPAEGGVVAFAGLCDGDTFTLVTCAPAPAIAHVHDRMPVILAPHAEAAWLDPARPFDAVAAHLAPYAAAPLAADEETPRQPDLFE